MNKYICIYIYIYIFRKHFVVNHIQLFDYPAIQFFILFHETPDSKIQTFPK